MKLSEYVKNYREKHRLSLRQMADQCDCSYQYISKLERDEVEVPTVKMLVRLARGMHITLHDLLTAVDDMNMYYSTYLMNNGDYRTEEESEIVDAYSIADQKTKKMVRMLLGLDE